MVERHRSDSGLRILDIGTGSGCIAVTLAAELPDARVTAVDISDTALRIARRNAERHRQTVRFERRDILTDPPDGEFDLIVSNPPYVTESEKAQMSPNVLRYEPHRALFVPDDDPLLFYRAIVGLGRRLLAPGGTVYFEINERFGIQTVELLENEGYCEIVLSEDFSESPNDPRAMEVKRSKTPEQALRTLMNVCAKNERSISDVRRSLARWGVPSEQQQPIIDRLVRERFIDEARYAEAYVREKLNLSRWGVRKIRAALRAKRIPEQTIDEALAQADPQKLGSKLEETLRRKMQGIRTASDYQMRGKLLRYGAGLGFDYDEVSDAIDRLMREREK
ncbi:MAG: RecX family transcriptional regulator [Alistipes sp.]